MRRFFVLATVFAVTLAAGCGWLKDGIEDLTTVDISAEIPAEFTVDASEACSTAIEGIDSCDQGGTAPAPMRITLDPIEFDLNVDVVEATGKSRLGDAVGRLESVTITSIDWEVRDNSLSFNLPETSLYVGKIDAESRDDESAFRVAKIPSIAAETDDSGTSPVSDDDQAKLSNLLIGDDQKDDEKLKLSVIPYTVPRIEQGQDVPPNGSATIDVTINAKFVAKPLSN